MEEWYSGQSFTACELGCCRQHNALVHDELSERIISATLVSKRGWVPLCCTKPRRRSGRVTGKGEKTHRGKREGEESVHYTKWIFPEHRCWSTLLSWPWCRVCTPTACAVPPLRPGSLSGMRTCLWGMLGLAPHSNLGWLLCSSPYMECLFVWAAYCYRMYCYQCSPMLWM